MLAKLVSLTYVSDRNIQGDFRSWLDGPHSKRDRKSKVVDRSCAGSYRAVIFVGLAGVMAVGVGAIHLRAATQAAPRLHPPVAVETVAIAKHRSYAVAERFAGRLEPAREAHLSFELSGLVVDVLVEEGDHAAKGDIVARLGTLKLSAERGRLLARKGELKANLALAEATFGRQRKLRDQGWQPEQSYDEARFAVAELRSAIERLDASIEAVDIDIEKAVLRAPFAGRIAGRLVDEGTVVEPGVPIVEILGSGRRHIRIGVPVDASDALNSGDTYRFASGVNRFAGRLVSERPDIQTGTRTITALFETDEAGDIPFGELVELVLEREIDAPGFWVPLSALTEGERGLWSVFAVDQTGNEERVIRQAVEVVHIAQEKVFVVGTLVDGLQVVVSGTNRVIAGQRVAVTREEAAS